MHYRSQLYQSHSCNTRGSFFHCEARLLRNLLSERLAIARARLENEFKTDEYHVRLKGNSGVPQALHSKLHRIAACNSHPVLEATRT